MSRATLTVLEPDAFMDNTELQIKVAEAMGWTIPDWCISKRRQRGEKERYLKGATPDFGTHPTIKCDMPDFTTDLNAAMQLVEVLRKEGWDFNAFCCTANGKPEWTVSVVWAVGEITRSEEAESASLTIAICKVFLAVKGMTTDQPTP